MRPGIIDGAGAGGTRAMKSRRPRSDEFSKILENSTKESVPEGSKGAIAAGKGGRLVPLGTISRENPTVSNLLIGNGTYGKECWKIVHGTQNSGKAFNRITAGTEIFIDPASREIVWGKEFAASSKEPGPGRIALLNNTESAGPVEKPKSAFSKEPAQGPLENPSTLGSKGLGRGAAGDPMTLASKGLGRGAAGDPITSFPKESVGESGVKPAGAYAKEPGPGLVDAVKPYMGKGYDEIDCYNLVVKGLGNLGVQYRGEGGLSEKLVAMAQVKGLPRNAYINGEGLIKASGKDVYTKVLRPVKDVEKATAEVMAEMDPLLEKGQILSFSTRRRGHTGIVSRMDDRLWTYINSGKIDNSVAEGAPVKGVGEEFLNEEVKNWIKLAAKEGEYLEISVGRFDKNALASFGKGNKGFGEKV